MNQDFVKSYFGETLMITENETNDLHGYLSFQNDDIICIVKYQILKLSTYNGKLNH